MNVHDLQMGETYRITAQDKRHNRTGKAVGLELYGDVIIEFKSDVIKVITSLLLLSGTFKLILDGDPTIEDD